MRGWRIYPSTLVVIGCVLLGEGHFGFDLSTGPADSEGQKKPSGKELPWGGGVGSGKPSD